MLPHCAIEKKYRVSLSDIVGCRIGDCPVKRQRRLVLPYTIRVSMELRLRLFDRATAAAGVLFFHKKTQGLF